MHIAGELVGDFHSIHKCEQWACICKKLLLEYVATCGGLLGGRKDLREARKSKRLGLNNDGSSHTPRRRTLQWCWFKPKAMDQVKQRTVCSYPKKKYENETNSWDIRQSIAFNFRRKESGTFSKWEIHKFITSPHPTTPCSTFDIIVFRMWKPGVP